ncbi:MAG: biotin--[acetyl-CoA-carboxylase] ligase, partial [Vicinamibacterales bacterium]
IGRRLIYLTSTGSTMNVARWEAENGAEQGTVIVADEQTAGRGRFGRAWVSPPGANLYLTLIVSPPVSRLRSLSIVTPLAVAEGIEQLTPLKARLKWPNDVLVSGRKISGILIESEVAGPTVRYALIGPGININFDVDESSEIAAIATSIKRELGHEVSREEVLAAFLNRFEALYEEAAGTTAVIDAWRSRLDTLGQEISVSFGGQVESGLAEDVDAEGNLILLRSDGSRIAIEAGEVTLRV